MSGEEVHRSKGGVDGQRLFPNLRRRTWEDEGLQRLGLVREGSSGAGIAGNELRATTARPGAYPERRNAVMPRYSLETLIVVLLLLWLLGWLIVPVGGSLIHLLLVIILVVVLIRLLQGRPPLA
jgi:hypothetical protein